MSRPVASTSNFLSSTYKTYIKREGFRYHKGYPNEKMRACFNASKFIFNPLQSLDKRTQFVKYAGTTGYLNISFKAKVNSKL